MVTEYWVIEDSMSRGVFSPTGAEKPKGYIPRVIGENIIERRTRDDECVYFTKEQAEEMRQHPEFKKTLTTTGEKKMHTKDILATELEKANLPEMAAKARTGWYHDFLSPLPTPCLQLDADLAKAGTRAALALRARHHNGEFDATPEESEDWAQSEDGQKTLGQLTSSMPR